MSEERIKLKLQNPDEAVELIAILYRMPECHFSICNKDNTKRLDARSFFGLAYMIGGMDELYLENDTKPGKYPNGLFRFAE